MERSPFTASIVGISSSSVQKNEFCLITKLPRIFPLPHCCVLPHSGNSQGMQRAGQRPARWTHTYMEKTRRSCGRDSCSVCKSLAKLA